MTCVSVAAIPDRSPIPFMFCDRFERRLRGASTCCRVWLLDNQVCVRFTCVLRRKLCIIMRVTTRYASSKYDANSVDLYLIVTYIP